LKRNIVEILYALGWIRALSGHGSWVKSVSFDAEGLLASGSYDGTIKLWNTKTGECLKTLSEHGHEVMSISFDRDGLLASGSYDYTTSGFRDGTIKL